MNREMPQQAKPKMGDVRENEEGTGYKISEVADNGVYAEVAYIKHGEPFAPIPKYFTFKNWEELTESPQK